MLRVVLTGAALGVVVCGGAMAQTVPAATAAPTPAAGCSVNSDPYTNYACLDTYLGSNVLDRFFRYYALELGHASAPSDPNAPPGRQADWPSTPETTPPMPFTEWPYGGSTPLGVTRPNSIDSPLMVAIANTSLGQWMSDNHFQLYGWVDPGFNVSTNSQKPGGNSPIAYAYTPNEFQVDQFVLYLDRFPDTVQTDHVDWGLRFSLLYGENYRYTTGFGYFSYQLLKNNNEYGYDFPMVYGEIYIPQVAHGLMIRVGRYISLPDIEAQLAPNNYMYTHSLTYAVDNYTNTGIVATLAVQKNLLVQAGLSDGTEAAPWHLGNYINNPLPAGTDQLYPGATFPKDPGAQPTFSACVRYSWNDEHDNVQPCANGINNGRWGYNNLQWYGGTYYHKFNDHWHISFEAYEEYQRGVPNNTNPEVLAIYGAGGTPLNFPFNSPNLAKCGNPTELRCTARAIGVVDYLNYSPDPLNNFSLRTEFYDDPQGQRTGTAADYYEVTFGWQHWLSPQIEFRPELGYYRSIDANAFNSNPTHGIAGTKNYTVIGAGDVIMHF